MKISRQGMTLIEMLIVSSLIAGVSLLLYRGLVNGIKVWERSQRLFVEEDIAIFFDKFGLDLKNTFRNSLISPAGSLQKFSFPTIVRTPADPKSNWPKAEVIDQLGEVEYFFEPRSNCVYRRQADYSQAIRETFGEKKTMACSINNLSFKYMYLTDQDNKFSQYLLEVFPSGIEVEIEFRDGNISKTMTRYFAIPLSI